MEIQIEGRKVYGNTLIYPYNDAAKLLAELVGKKTLSYNDLRIARQLGHTIVPVLAINLPVAA